MKKLARKFYGYVVNPASDEELKKAWQSSSLQLPVVWLLGKTGAGKSSIVQQLTGHSRVVFFEQVTQVGIDLYSGRLKFSEAELLAYRNAQEKPEEIDIKPLSVMFIGQVNAGKSSLINTLKQQCVADLVALRQ